MDAVIFTTGVEAATQQIVVHIIFIQVSLFLSTSLSVSCLSVPQSASRWRGVPARAEEGSVSAGQSPRPEGGRQSAGLRLESAKEMQSKETSDLFRLRWRQKSCAESSKRN